jgi:hypothetical protein
MKPAEFAGKHLARLGVKVEKITYCSRVYPLPILESKPSMAMK